MNIDTLIIYVFVAFFYIISPGPAILLAIYNGAWQYYWFNDVINIVDQWS